MPIQIRPMKLEDVETCGRICYEAFKDIADKHNFRPDFPSAETSIEITRSFFDSPYGFNRF